MPSASATCLAAGYAILESHAGEPLAFRGGTVTGTVNRSVERPSPDSPDFDPRDLSDVSVPANLTPTPAPGESFVDADGLHHRIKTVGRRGVAIICRCLVSEEAAP